MAHRPPSPPPRGPDPDDYSREPDLDALDRDVDERPNQPTQYKGRGTGVAIGHRYDKVRRTAPEAAEGVIWLRQQAGSANAESASSPDSRSRGRAEPRPDPGQAHDPGDDPGADPAGFDEDPGPVIDTEIRFEQARQIIATNDSPDVPFEQSINPYRGCEHGCIYCFARPTHAYLDLSPGLDFERIIIAKANAADRFRAQLARPGYRCRTVTFGAATDPYQPVERKLGITRQLLEVAVAHRHPFYIVTKNALVERDLDLIAPMAAERMAGVMVTITTLDPGLARILEPRASAPQRRLRAIRTLTTAGVPVALSVGPVIPFINEPDIERIIELAAAAGVQSVHYTVVRLPWEVAPLFEQWLADHFPDRAERVMARIAEMRGGRRNDPRFGSRMRGEGVYADLIRARVQRAARQHGLAKRAFNLDESKFIRPLPKATPDDGLNLSLF